MKKNIFEYAKFGDKFLSRDGGIAILLEENDDGYVMMYEEICTATVSSLGLIDNCNKSDYDIVSCYQEPIDEKKLDELACEWCQDNADINEDGWAEYDGREAYKAGYRKAIQFCP